MGASDNWPKGPQKCPTRGIYKNTEWWRNLANIDKDHTKEMLSNDGEDGLYQARYTMCPLHQRPEDTPPATQVG
jgi:hypothetical protein